MRLKSTLEQWNTLRAIERAGSIQAAATSLSKSHTTLIYAVKKLEQQVGVRLVEVQGRRAVLTEQGKILLRRANHILDQTQELEAFGQQLVAGLESEITIAVDHLCDLVMVYQAMATFMQENRATSVQVVETSLSKTTAMVVNEQADIAIITLPITNYPAEAFALTRMLPVVAAHHPLAQQPSVLMGDFAAYCQIVLRDLGAESHQQQNVGWLKASQRVTVDNFEHALRAIEQGVGFCRLPEHLVQARNHGQLSILQVEESHVYHVPLHITLPKGGKTGPAARQFYDCLLACHAPTSKHPLS